MRSILGHASKILFDNDTQLLLTPKFWILPLYRELLNSARRIRPSASSERARGCTGLVKVICKENKEQKGKRKYHAGTPQRHDYVGAKDALRSASGEALRQADHAVDRMTPLEGTTSQIASQPPSAPS